MIRLLPPFYHGMRHRFLGGHRTLRSAGIIAFGALLVAIIYLLSLRTVGYFHRQNELGVILSLKILEMAWMITATMLLFSSMITGVSALFLSRDNTILHGAPVPPAKIFAMRYLTTTIYTSWMMVLFSMPVFGSYGTVFDAGPLFWPLLLFTVCATAAMANGLGLGVTILLVTVFPARRTRDIVVYLSLLFGILLYLVIRLIKPEQLANPERFPEFIDYLGALSTPASPLLPPAWAARLLTAFLIDHRIDWLLAGLLLLTPVMVYFGTELLMERFFFNGYSKAQESFGGNRAFRARPYRPQPALLFFSKELRLFLRDSNEWSQLFLIGALVVVYLYNFKVLPIDRSPMPTEYLVNSIAYANIGLTGFLVSSLAARFVYPSVGAEGAAFGLILSGPISLQRYLGYKYLFYVTPFTLLALVLLLVSNHLLGISGPMQWISLASGLCITWTAVAMALGFGAAHADFKEENRAATLGGFGAILFLFCALSFALVCIALGSVPAYTLTKTWLRSGFITAEDLLWPILALLTMIFLAFWVSWYSLRWGRERVGELFH